jgi:NAD(P)-dependent dehydrogenase (short-subunit alcohol dehydrogenase family)
VFDQMPDERWERSFQVNFMGSVRLCRAMVPKMAEQGRGAVVITGSDLAKQPEPGFMDYGACKSALLYLAKALAKQYAPAVRVNTVLPGPIWSRMWTRPGGIVDQLVEHYGLNRDASVKRFLEDRQMPMGIGQPEDVAHAVVFLASPRARFISGAALDIGGTIRGLI